MLVQDYPFPTNRFFESSQLEVVCWAKGYSLQLYSCLQWLGSKSFSKMCTLYYNWLIFVVLINVWMHVCIWGVSYLSNNLLIKYWNTCGLFDWLGVFNSCTYSESSLWYWLAILNSEMQNFLTKASFSASSQQKHHVC